MIFVGFPLVSIMCTGFRDCYCTEHILYGCLCPPHCVPDIGLQSFEIPKGRWCGSKRGWKWFFSLGKSPNRQLRKLLRVVYFYISLPCMLPWREFTFICIFIFKGAVLFPGLDVFANEYFTSCVKDPSVELLDLVQRNLGLFSLIA